MRKKLFVILVFTTIALYAVGYRPLLQLAGKVKLIQGSSRRSSSRNIKKVNVEKESDVYVLIRLYESQKRSIDLLNSALDWFKNNPTGPGSEDIGHLALIENFDRMVLPKISSDTQRLCRETNKLNDAISNASPYFSDKFNMNRRANIRRINALPQPFQALHTRTRETLRKRWSALRGGVVLTKRDKIYMQMYEDIFDMLPEQISRQAITHSLSDRFKDYLGGEEDVYGGAFNDELSDLLGKREVFESLKTNPSFNQDQLVKTYTKLYQKRLAATKKLVEGWKMRNEKIVVESSDDYTNSVLGFNSLRKDLETELVGKIVIKFSNRFKIKKSRKVKLPKVVLGSVANPIYGVALTYRDPRRYFLFAIDTKKGKMAGSPIRLPIQPISAIRSREDLLLLKDDTRLLFFDSKKAKFTDQMIVPQSGTIKLVDPDEDELYIEDGLFGATVVNTKTRQVVDQRPRLPDPFQLVKNVDGKTLIVSLEPTDQKFRYVVAFYDVTTHEKVGESVELPNTPVEVAGVLVSVVSEKKIYISLEHLSDIGGTEVRQAGQNLAVIDTATRSLKTFAIDIKPSEINPSFGAGGGIRDMATGSDGTIYLLHTYWQKYWIRLLDKNSGRVIRSIGGRGRAKSFAVGKDKNIYVAVSDSTPKGIDGLHVYTAENGNLIQNIELPKLKPWFLFD